MSEEVEFYVKEVIINYVRLDLKQFLECMRLKHCKTGELSQADVKRYTAVFNKLKRRKPIKMPQELYEKEFHLFEAAEANGYLEQFQDYVDSKAKPQ